jgi:predicted DNA-binding transcriptional regulator YafY
MTLNNRRLTIMRLLDSRKKFTARELAEQFEVSVRTIQRDLDYLQGMGFPLYTEVGVHGGYRVLPNRILPPLQLTQHEALGLFMMIEYLEKVPDFPYGAIRAQLAQHYFSELPSDVQDTIISMRQHITFLEHHSLPPVPTAQSITTEILSAAVEQREIRFSYSSRSGMKMVEAYPIGIYYEHGYWYMPAKKHERVLLYRVDRMGQLALLDGCDSSIPKLQDWLNAKDTREGVEVILQWTDFGVRLAQSDTLFTSIQDNEWRAEVPEEEFSFIARKLLSYGPDVKVVSPPQLQGLLLDMLNKSMEQYNK